MKNHYWLFIIAYAAINLGCSSSSAKKESSYNQGSPYMYKEYRFAHKSLPQAQQARAFEYDSQQCLSTIEKDEQENIEANKDMYERLTAIYGFKAKAELLSSTRDMGFIACMTDHPGYEDENKGWYLK